MTTSDDALRRELAEVLASADPAKAVRRLVLTCIAENVPLRSRFVTAIMSRVAGPLLVEVARLTEERDKASRKGIEAGIAAAIQGLSATILNAGGECDRRGFQDPETGEVPCDGEEDCGCTCSAILEFGDRAIKNLRSADIDKIAALLTAKIEEAEHVG